MKVGQRRRGGAHRSAGALALLMLLSLPGALALLASPAQADNWSGATGVNGCAFNMADNRDHFFYYRNILADTQTAVSWSRKNNLDPTVVNTYNESNGLNNSTDVVVHDEDYEGTICGTTWQSDPNTIQGTRGAARCWYLTSAGKCDQYYVEFDLDYMGPRSAEAEAKLACHELGHTLGLTHRTMDTSCMQSGATTANRWFDDHDRGHLPNL